MEPLQDRSKHNYKIIVEGDSNARTGNRNNDEAV